MMLSNSVTNDSIRAVHSVSELCSKTRAVLEEKFSSLWVAGEIASISVPASGHWYLSLKDDKAQLRCVMFKAANTLCKKPKIGDEVLVSGRFSLYEARGDLQLILHHLEARGAGILFKKFEELKVKLRDQGMFDAAHKRPIPPYPKRIALITSPTGAAIEDIFSVFRRNKFDALIKVFPSQVQGESAPQQLIRAIQQADAEPDFDLILLSRGGGSYEDLFCFNDELLAQTIFATKTPIISAVGHETDVTIADFVADLRCATPTAAAEKIVAGQILLSARLTQVEAALAQALRTQLASKKHLLVEIKNRIRSPVHQLQNFQQRLDNIQQQFHSKIDQRIRANLHETHLLLQKLKSYSPQTVVKNANYRLKEARKQLLRLGAERFALSQREFVRLCRHLEAVSPLSILARGYSLLLDGDQNIVKSVQSVKAGDALSARLFDGIVELEAKKINSLPDSD